MTIARLVVDLNWTGASGSPGVNTFHVAADFEPLEGQVYQSWSDEIEGMYNSLKNFMATGLVISTSGEWISVKQEDEGTVLHTSDPWTVNGNGGAYLPPSNQAVITWKTEQRKRFATGRTFFGPLGRSFTLDDAGTPGTEFLNALNAAAVGLYNHPTIPGGMAVWSRTKQTAYQITGHHVSDQFAVLRSRRD